MTTETIAGTDAGLEVARSVASSSIETPPSEATFADLGLSPEVLKAVVPPVKLVVPAEWTFAETVPLGKLKFPDMVTLFRMPPLLLKVRAPLATVPPLIVPPSKV